MLTAFVRINIVLVLLRQALGSPQVPGNQVLTALALLLTALVMRPVGESVYARSIEPFAEGRDRLDRGVRRGQPADQGVHARTDPAHQPRELRLGDLRRGRRRPARPAPVYGDEFPLGVVATAFLLSELTTALVIGFYLYLPFLVVDLVVSSVLAAMGLFMLPPSLVSLPLKLILFVLADGWVLVATMLLQSFGPVGGVAVRADCRRRPSCPKELLAVETSLVVDWSQEAIRLALQLGGPLLAVALVAGWSSASARR